MALTDYYVDPAINANSGTGTIGDPFGDLQYALNTVTRDATNGDRFNIKAGTAEVLAAAISLATYGTPGTTSPLVFQGYTAVADDGGIGEINNGGANVAIISSATLDSISFVDMKLGNTGTAKIVELDRYVALINCEIHSSSAAGAVTLTNDSGLLKRCWFHDLTGNAPIVCNVAFYQDCVIEYGVSGQYAVVPLGQIIMRGCVFALSGNARGVSLVGAASPIVEFCSFYSNGGGVAININSNLPIVTNNIIAGFSGVGGVGISQTATRHFHMHGPNFYYNNTTNVSATAQANYRVPDITLTNAPFTNPGAGDFSIAAAAKAELQAQGWPSSFLGISTNQYLDPGAAQIQAAAGGAFPIFGGVIAR
jgi:hypothetical protein